MECEVWSAKSAVCSVRGGVSREGYGRDRLFLNYRLFMFGKLPPPACPGLCYDKLTGMRLPKNNAWDPRLKPYGALDTERLQITGIGVWKAEKYLSDEFWIPYIEVRALEF